MNIQTLIKNAEKPAIYTPGTSLMWTDDHISKQLLNVHLSQDTDLASRKKASIDTTVNWILDRAPKKQMTILDLGCGPGLYTERLAQKSHGVTGMDFSSRAIAHAKQSAAEKNLDITYIQDDYLNLDQNNQYDLIMMIYTDFGVLSPGKRQILLKKIYQALKPGGIFIFDVLNTHYSQSRNPASQWDVAQKGFWKNRPYLALSQSFYYETEQVGLNQHIIVDESGAMDVYRFYVHTFSHSDLEKILEEKGFHTTDFQDNLLPGCELYESDDLTFCVTMK